MAKKIGSKYPKNVWFYYENKITGMTQTIGNHIQRFYFLAKSRLGHPEYNVFHYLKKDFLDCSIQKSIEFNFENRSTDLIHELCVK